MSKSANKRLPTKFRKLSVAERIASLHAQGYIDQQHYDLLTEGKVALAPEQANQMVENAVGVFALPQGIAINMPINHKHYAVPMVLEEPSVIAALSYSALLASKAGGFSAEGGSGVLSGQIQIVKCPDFSAAQTAIEEKGQELIDLANSGLSKMMARGGGVRKIGSRVLWAEQSQEKMLVVQVDVDTCDAMGANVVNTLCEQLAPAIQSICGGEVLLRILSNLSDQSIARAEVCFPPALLACGEYNGEQVRDRIVLANDLALADPYRAATHNKGIMNGIDPLAIATGNDWRALEAGIHAYAARSGAYRGLTHWRVDEQGRLKGSIQLPIKVGTVGAALEANPAVKINRAILGVTSAKELSAVMAAVGLAQNFAALRALVTSGIQRGHMTLHARSAALSAGVPSACFDRVVQQLVSEGDIKVDRAKRIYDAIRSEIPEQGGDASE